MGIPECSEDGRHADGVCAQRVPPLRPHAGILWRGCLALWCDEILVCVHIFVPYAREYVCLSACVRFCASSLYAGSLGLRFKKRSLLGLAWLTPRHFRENTEFTHMLAACADHTPRLPISCAPLGRSTSGFGSAGSNKFSHGRKRESHVRTSLCIAHSPCIILCCDRRLMSRHARIAKRELRRALGRSRALVSIGGCSERAVLLQSGLGWHLAGCN